MSNKRLFVAGGVVVLALLLVVAGLALSDSSEGDLPEGVFFRDDFSDVAEHWSLDSYKGITTDIRDGGYLVELERPNSSAHEGVSFDHGTEHDAVTVAASVTFKETAEGATIGLTCGYVPGDAESITGLFGRYQAEIGLDGSTRIVRILNDDEVVLDERRAPEAPEKKGPNELELTCDYNGQTAAIELVVNGQRALAVEDRDPFETFESAGMYTATKSGGLTVVFDDLQAEEPGS